MHTHSYTFQIFYRLVIIYLKLLNLFNVLNFVIECILFQVSRIQAHWHHYYGILMASSLQVYLIHLQKKLGLI